MNFVVGIPRCNEPSPLFTETLSAIDASSRKPSGIIIVDNGDEPLRLPWMPVTDVVRPGSNIGCAGAWNLIHKFAAPLPAVIVNADLAVAPDTFERMLASPTDKVICAYGFGCFLVPRHIQERVGPFDEEFWPVYWEDTDYRYRCKLAGVELDEWPVDAVALVGPGRRRAASSIAHGKDEPQYQGWSGERLEQFHACVEKNRQRYIAKWGGGHTEERFTVPWDGRPPAS